MTSVPPDPPKRRLSKPWRVVCVIVAGLIPVIAAELALGRFHILRSESLRKSMESRRFVPLPEYRPGSTRLKAGESGNSELITDENGFLNPHPEHSVADRRLIFFGEHNLEGAHLPPEERIHWSVGKALQSLLKLRINSYNAAVESHHSFHSTLSLLGKGLPLEPDIAVICHNTGDLRQLLSAGDYWTLAENRSRGAVIMPGRDVFDLLWWERPRDYTGWRAGLDFLVPNIHRRFLGGRNAGRLRANESPARVPSPVIVDELFSGSLKTFIGICRAAQIRPVLMTQPAALQHFGEMHSISPLIPLDRYPFWHDRVNQLIRDIAEEEGVLLIDLAAEFSGRNDIFQTPLHLNVDGSRQAAEIISNALMNVLEKEKSGPTLDSGRP